MVPPLRILRTLTVFQFLFMVLVIGQAWAQKSPGQEAGHQQDQQSSPAAAADDSVQALIRSKVQDRAAEPIQVGEASVIYSQILEEFYRNRDYRAAWTNRQNMEALLEAVRKSPEDGLLPDDYHLETIENLLKQTKGEAFPEQTASLDILLSDALFRLSYHLLYGKVNPQSLFPDWSLSRTGLSENLPKAGQEAIDAGQIDTWLESLRPENSYYAELKGALANYRKIAAQGGWRTIPPGDTLKQGSKGSRVSALRQRLALTGDFEAAIDKDADTDKGADTEKEADTEKKEASEKENQSQVYDEAVAKAVKRFQDRHSLEQTGEVDGTTLEALNLPVAQRIDQIRVNLERARWALREPLEKNQVIVNIAAFKLYYIKGEGERWDTKVVVGKPFWKTPLIVSKIDTVIFNPEWNVPTSIAKAEILPKMKKDKNYLKKRNFRLESRDPWRIVQESGPGNALGRLKFMFPNDYSVYLHDTPAKELFEESSREFSHGCIRVQDPRDLAERLIKDPEWDKKKIRSVIDSKKTVSKNLKEPVPIAVIYRTVEVMPDSEVRFLPDVYQRDFAVLSALQQQQEKIGPKNR